jgi:NAD(P)-dependent dehydrogenase (short-subunit alcohol dehydrogenase family)
MGQGMRFTGRTAVVTGSSGIALGVARKLASEGARLRLWGIDEQANATARDALAAYDVTVSKVDVADESEVIAATREAIDANGHINILVNAAGIQTYGDLETTDVAHWDRVMNINLRSCFLTSHHIYPAMRKAGGGAITHIASVQGYSNQVGVLAYATSKAAQQALARAMAVDCARHKVRVNSVSPGSIRTPLLEYSAQELARDGKSIEDMIAAFGEEHPIGRVGTAEEVGDLVAFLSSDAAAFITGADYLIDGGLHALLNVK